jgi:hypothetical protein
MLAIGQSTTVRYAGVFLATGGIFPVVANLFPWCLNNQRSDTKRGVGMVMFQLIGQCGTILGTRLYPLKQAPHYVTVSSYHPGNFSSASFLDSRYRRLTLLIGSSRACLFARALCFSSCCSPSHYERCWCWRTNDGTRSKHRKECGLRRMSSGGPKCGMERRRRVAASGTYCK